jgi:hypothetical protein
MFLLGLFPILYAPLFASFSQKYGMWAGIYISLLASLMVKTPKKFHIILIE